MSPKIGSTVQLQVAATARPWGGGVRSLCLNRFPLLASPATASCFATSCPGRWAESLTGMPQSTAPLRKRAVYRRYRR